MLSLMMLIYVTILIILMLCWKQACRRPTWALWATWCPRAPCWWPLHYTNIVLMNTCTESQGAFTLNIYCTCNDKLNKKVLSLLCFLQVLKAIVYFSCK